MIHDVHTRHCCRIHGCKYGDADCTVVVNKLDIAGCEECGLEEEGYYGPVPRLIEQDRDWEWRAELTKYVPELAVLSFPPCGLAPQETVKFVMERLGVIPRTAACETG